MEKLLKHHCFSIVRATTNVPIRSFYEPTLVR